ncbi:biliverdin-producing heme oxygenase [Sphingomonas morindae]|uniref:Biliverdin-producing heme oxygenase n=1 Tax=Sphingomonas morindae TaxID=1541170 RepID=A0ABY4XA80_9SPHN|nr:biliverdin-producing heme oxygenase [Sphingomonas morindae]USI73656.1 biliverdin-producing heme oxygenase [Sphingomonas morindae]
MTKLIVEGAPLLHEESRAKRLKALTCEQHAQLDSALSQADTFASVEAYGRFLVMQLQFHRAVDALYRHPRLQALIPQLVERRRLPLVALDLSDLGLSAPPPVQPPVFAEAAPIEVATALGWLYVAEGSNLGASLLRKQVAKIGLSDDFGARHLAPAREGPAEQWRRFVEALDAAPLSVVDDARAGAGAREAFALVRSLADRHIF